MPMDHPPAHDYRALANTTYVLIGDADNCRVIESLPNDSQRAEKYDPRVVRIKVSEGVGVGYQVLPNLVITAGHVAIYSPSEIHYFDGDVIAGETVARDPVNDIALVQTSQSKNFPETI